jgi:hypothetical protein
MFPGTLALPPGGTLGLGLGQRILLPRPGLWLRPSALGAAELPLATRTTRPRLLAGFQPQFSTQLPFLALE